MKSPKDYLDDYKINGMSGLLSSLILEIQKDAYNQAIEDVFEYQLLNGCLETNEDMVNNLKIK